MIQHILDLIQPDTILINLKTDRMIINYDCNQIKNDLIENNDDLMIKRTDLTGKNCDLMGI